jgi:hypothetical protein
MVSQSQGHSSKEMQNNMNDIKDSVANITTIAGPGGMVLGWNEALTMVLILTGIVLNVLRIYEIKKSRKKD